MNKDRCCSTLSWLRYLLGNATSVAATYGKRKRQVDKDFMYMMTALWMEQSPWNFKYPEKQNPVGEEKGLNVVGAVFVLPNDRVLSADCSRRNNSKVASQMKADNGIVHGAVQALVKYPDRVKDCQVYLSRKPCAHCVKMLVQAAVSKVFYLPLRPEKDAEDENKSVDALFQVSTVSRSFFPPDITNNDIHELTAEEKGKQDKDPKNPYGICLQNLGEQGKNYAKEEWKKWKPNIQRQLFWQEFEGKIEEQVDEDMKRMFEWFNTATFATGYKKDMDWKAVGSKKPEDNKEIQPEVASHLSRLAQMLSNRTDDPKRGVGCVITVEDEIVSIGWNGFPSKALYGNHPRGSESDKNTKSKYPHVIHAEQNALMCRNRRQLTDGIAYVNRPPCNECMPMLYQLGIKTFVLPEKTKQRENERYFDELLEKGETIVYRHVKPRDCFVKKHFS